MRKNFIARPIAILLVLIMAMGVGMPTVVTAAEGHSIKTTIFLQNWSDIFEGYLAFSVDGTEIDRLAIGEHFGLHMIFTATTSGSYSITADLPGYVIYGVITNASGYVIEGQNLNLGRISQDLEVIIFVTPGQAQGPRPTPSPTNVPSAPNLNTADDWGHNAISNAVYAGLVPENLQGHYRHSISRAEFTALAVALYETVTGTEITGRVKFADTVDPNVEKAAYLGIVTGTGGGNFSPNIPFSREQAAVIISRLMYAIGEPLPEAAPTFGDTDRISAWARDSVGQVQAAGIMSGTGQNLFTPHGTFTRQESIFVTWRLFTLLT